jgi:hypothetical protein
MSAIIDSSTEHPLLSLLLNERLPTLGLDVDTYGPYIVALFPLASLNSTTATTMCSDDDDENMKELNEGWDEIVELLQASSDIEDSLDETAWIQLKHDLTLTWRSYLQQQRERQQLLLVERELSLQKTLEGERELALLNAMKLNETTETNTDRAIDDAAKRALLNRFAYEDSSDVDGSEGKTEESNGASDAATDQHHSHKGKNTVPVTTKREEQQKTKLQVQQKIDAKEERRKRAVKGERRR